MNLEAIKIIVLACQLNTGNIDNLLHSRVNDAVRKYEKQCRRKLINCYMHRAPKGAIDALVNCLVEK